MCGICGFASLAASTSDSLQHRIRTMTDALIHRGPDDQGHWVADGIAIGMRRLSIIDLATGRQPRLRANKMDLVRFIIQSFSLTVSRTVPKS